MDADDSDVDQVCDVCVDGTVYENNEILICESCNVAVHQLCYGVDVIPEGAWYCEVCRGGGKPSKTRCVICQHTSGAFKKTEKKGKWVHGLCALWVPKVYYDPSKGGIYNVSHIDKARYKIGCKLCSHKGAVVQCCFGRCCVGAHPWCAVRHNKGFTHRVVKSPIDPSEHLFEIFCALHASSVDGPVKPKVNGNRSSLPDHSVENTVATPKNNSHSLDQSSKNRRRSGIENSNNEPIKNTPRRRGSPSNASTPTRAQRTSAMKVAPEVEKIVENGIINSSQNRSISRKGISKPGGNVDDTSEEIEVEDLSEKAGYAVYTASEWPGKAESEPMDLNHFWDVVAMWFPEDHDEQWIDFMASRLRLGPANPFFKDYENYIPPPLGSLKDTIEKLRLGDSEVLSSGLSDRDFVALMDPDKRGEFENKITKLINVIDEIPSARASYTAKASGLKKEVSTELDAMSPVKTQSKAIRERQPSTDEAFCFDKSGVHYLTRLEFPFEGFDDADEKKPQYISVLFNGPKRRKCVFSLRQRDPNTSAENSQWRYPVKGFHCCSETDDSYENSGSVGNDPSSFEKLFTACGILGVQTTMNTPASEGVLRKTEIKLDGVESYSSSNSVLLGDRELIPLEEENDEICELIRHDQAVYRDLLESMTGVVDRLLRSDAVNLARSAVKQLKQKQADEKAILTSYTNQRIWGSICRSVMRGIRDQTKDFNKHHVDVVPASWAIEVEGRPTEEQLKAINDDVNHIDAVCMCCFDGTSSDDANRIIFCDGCNTAVHQMCYGISVVPDGDFFCDRCEYIKDLSQGLNFGSENENLKGLVSCCLCPLYHGALKKTTDGRWVHLACAIWSGKADIHDLKRMGPVDISRVPFMGLTAAERREDSSLINSQPVNDPTSSGPGTSARRDNISASSAATLISIERPGVSCESQLQGSITNAPDTSISTNVCSVCNKGGGYMVGCSAKDCGNAFHPICAWFTGLYIFTELTDPSFLGQPKLGSECMYPSGLNFTFHCLSHTPTGVSHARAMQRDLRRLYMISELDLCYIPGRAPKRRRVKKKNQSISNATKRLVGTVKPKDLNVDIYGSDICAICLGPAGKIFPKVSEVNENEKVISDSQKNIPDSHAWLVKCVDCALSVHRKCLVPSLGSRTRIVTMSSLQVQDIEITSRGDHQSGPTLSPPSPLDDSLECAISLSAQSIRCMESQCDHTPMSEVKNAKPSTNEQATKTGFPGTGYHKAEEMEMVPSNPTIDPNSLQNVDISNWKCVSCTRKNAHIKQEDEGRDAAPLPELRCAACPRRGGMFITVDGKWFHHFCATYKPTRSGQICKDGKKQNCVYCNRKTGLCTRCSHHESCGQLFHPICAARAGDCFIRIRNGVKEYFCSNHIPSGIYRLPNGYWVDSEEVARLRRSLNNALIILDLIRVREKSKKKYYSTRGEIFVRNIELALRRLKKSRGLRTSEEVMQSPSAESVTMNEIESGSGIIHRSGGGSKPLQVPLGVPSLELSTSIAPIKRKHHTTAPVALLRHENDTGSDIKSQNLTKKQRRPRKKQNDESDTAITSTSAFTFSEPRPPTVPAKVSHELSVKLGSQQLSHSNFAKSGGYSGYSRIVREDMFRKVGESEMVDFETELGAHVDCYLHESTRKITSKSKMKSVPKYDLEVEIKTKDIAEMEKGGEGKCGEEIRAEVIPKKRKRAPDEDSPAGMKQRDSPTSILAKTAVPTLPRVDSLLVDRMVHRFIDSGSGFQCAVDKFVPDLLSNKGSEWTAVGNSSRYCAAQSAVRLERVLATILAILSDVCVPCEGIFGNIDQAGSSDACISALIRCLAEKKDISTHWWNNRSSSSQPKYAHVRRTRLPSSRASKQRSKYSTSSVEDLPSSVPSSGETSVSDGRMLSEDFDEIPYHIFPKYNSLVVHPISLGIMKRKLQDHLYHSFAQFSKDFYEMLSNGRQITDEMSKTWWDSSVLGGIFAYLRQLWLESSPGRCALNIYSTNTVIIKKCDDKCSTDGTTIRDCAICEEKWTLFGNCCSTLPSASISDAWKWVCPDCFSCIHIQVLRLPVKVYWSEDAKYYDGKIEDYDDVSCEHRVYYVGSEWEFLQLQKEDFLLRLEKGKFEELVEVIRGDVQMT